MARLTKTRVYHGASRRTSRLPSGAAGFTIIELMIVLLVGMTLTAIALPVFNRALVNMQVSSMVNALSAAISSTHERSIMNSQVYTLVLTVPGNTYVVNNVSANTSEASIPLPGRSISINGGTSGTYTFTLCPNGTVYGSGGTCPNGNSPPALSVTYQNRQINVTTSSVGNVTKATIH